jgi:hypothetical protein
VAAVAGGGIHTSGNSGTTWTQTSAPTTYAWSCIGSSSDGTELVAAVAGGGIYISGDSGVTWAPTGVPTANWASVASSTDGIKLVAAVAGGGIYTDIMPLITQQPESVLSCPGGSPTFEIAAGGAPLLGFRWRKNETNLVDVGNVTGSATATLTLLNVTPLDTANYDVVVTNAYGSATSSVATLTVARIPAKATPIVVNGFIIGAILLEGGCGYTSPPAISFSGQGGSGAVAYAQISNGAVTNIAFTSAGFGYPTNTVLLIAPPVFPTLGFAQPLLNLPPATATPIIANGFVIGASLISGSSDYPEAPTVSFSDVSGHGASAYALVTNGSVVSIVISNAGIAYSTNTALTISAPPTLSAFIPNASGLMAGQTYQLNLANKLNNWTDYGSPFVATNSAWTSTDHWNMSLTNRVFFRLRLFQ